MPFQRSIELRPDRIVAPAVFRSLARGHAHDETFVSFVYAKRETGEIARWQTPRFGKSKVNS